jgi:hypothetical protein
MYISLLALLFFPTAYRVGTYDVNIYIIMWSCPGNMPKYYPGLRDILPRFERHITRSKWRVICLSDLGNILAYYLDKTTLISLLY